MKNTSTNSYTVKYSSELTHANLRVEVYRRSYATVLSTDFISVPFSNLFSNSMTILNENEVSLDMSGRTTKTFDFTLADELISGTYKIAFKLYDSNQLIDEDIKYVIVKKKVNA